MAAEFHEASEEKKQAAKRKADAALEVRKNEQKAAKALKVNA